jgi:hypothetical protein
MGKAVGVMNVTIGGSSRSRISRTSRSGGVGGNGAGRAFLAVIGSVSSFTLLIDTVGLIPAVIAASLVASHGSRDTRPGESLLFAAGLALVMSVLFVLVLGQPIPLIGAW